MPCGRSSFPEKKQKHWNSFSKLLFLCSLSGKKKKSPRAIFTVAYQIDGSLAAGASHHDNTCMFVHIDFDAFYCGVEEKYNAELKDTPFIVYQKNIIATLSYAARTLGLKKLGLVSEAKKRFPDVTLVNGESLVRYRREGKMLWNFVREKVRGCGVERLGMEELWIDLSATVEHNYGILEQLGFMDYLDSLGHGDVSDDENEPLDGIDLWLSPDEDGGKVYCENFSFDLPAKVFPERIGHRLEDLKDHVRVYIAGHLAYQLHELIYMETGYACSVGVGSNKTVSKMIGSMNKPNGVTVLLPGFEQEYLNNIPVSKIPYFGAKSVGLLKQELACEDPPTVTTVRDRFTKEEFLKLITDEHLWSLLHGEDDTPIKDTPEYPLQISIEDTFRQRPIRSQDQLRTGFLPLLLSLFEQAMVDLIDIEAAQWDAYPTTLRISTGYATTSNMKVNSSSTKLPVAFHKLAKLTTAQDASQREELGRELIEKHILRVIKYPPIKDWSIILLRVAVVGIDPTHDS